MHGGCTGNATREECGVSSEGTTIARPGAEWKRNPCKGGSVNACASVYITLCIRLEFDRISSSFSPGFCQVQQQYDYSTMACVKLLTPPSHIAELLPSLGLGTMTQHEIVIQ
jgi:hypothetical protein